MKIIVNLAIATGLVFLVTWLFTWAWNSGPAQAFTFCNEITMLQSLCLWLIALAFAGLRGRGGVNASHSA